MPLRHKSAQKRARQTIKRTEKNKKVKVLIKTSIKKVLSSKEKTDALAEFKKTAQTLDRAATKGIIPKNKAANTKSKLAKHINKTTK
ncbi:MAG: 30S ribosomal protein S20 [Ignavibacteria bacterium]|nr:30S ribosomal protein S20 [Ignavibacteria bacterium]